MKKILHVSILLALSGCDVGPQGDAKKAVAATLTDPSSVQFQNVTSYSNNVICGEFNAKNQMGGYVGFKPFVYSWHGLVSYDIPANTIALCNNDQNKVEVRTIQLTKIRVKPEQEGDGPEANVQVSIDVPVAQWIMHPETSKIINAQAREVISKSAPTQLLDRSKLAAMESDLRAKINDRLWPGKKAEGIQKLSIYASQY